MNSILLKSLKQQNQLKQQSFQKLIAKGGGPLPHYDPPNMKKRPFNRMIPMTEHLLWFKTATSMEYIFNLKHNQYKGMKGTFMMIIKYMIFGTFLPVLIICKLKRISQDGDNYYNDRLCTTNNDLTHNGNTSHYYGKILKTSDDYHNSDCLDRRSGDFYKHGFPILVRDRSRTTWFEKKKQNELRMLHYKPQGH